MIMNVEIEALITKTDALVLNINLLVWEAQSFCLYYETVSLYCFLTNFPRYQQAYKNIKVKNIH